MNNIEALRQLLGQRHGSKWGVSHVEYAVMLVLITTAVAAFGLVLSLL